MTMMMNATSTLLATGNGSLPTEQLVMLPPFQHNEPQHHQLTLETAKVIVSSADIFEQALKESGRSYDPNLPLQFAMASHTASCDIYAREQAEKRGYFYDNFQRGIDREISEEQHQETITCMQEEPGWSRELDDARDRGRAAISTAIIHAIAFIVLVKLAPIFFLVFVQNEGKSLTVIAAEIIGTVSLER
jgi:hypothetical protein